MLVLRGTNLDGGKRQIVIMEKENILLTVAGAVANGIEAEYNSLVTKGAQIASEAYLRGVMAGANV